jgi:hypothetical protein
MSYWRNLVTKISDTESRIIRADASTHSLINVEFEENSIHEGSHYFIEDIVTLDATNALDIGIQTPNTTSWLHMVWVVVSDAQVTLQIYEGSTITFDGTDITPLNNNRNSSNTSGIVNMEKNPTVTAVGTLLATASLGTSTTPNAGIPGQADRNRELILKQNTNYLFRITSGVNGNNITYLYEWYEHTRKD